MTTDLTTTGTGSQADGKPPIMPTLVQRCLADGYGGEWDLVRSLAILKRGGFDGQVPALAAQMAVAAKPIDHDKLVQRLTALGMAMAPNRAPAEASMWVRETARLLRDLPEDIVLDAVDAHQRISRFLPTVAEIRERAEVRAVTRRKDAARLDAMARLIASGATIPELPAPEPAKPRKADRPMTADEIEEMNAIMARVGASLRYYPDGRRYEVERTADACPISRRSLRKPTRQDYLDMGVDPSVLDGIEAQKSAVNQ